MRFTFHLAAAVAAALSATAVAAAQTGNGAPSGPHYNLNIIGVSHDKNPNMNGNGSGNVIFVDLGTKSGVAVTTKILLSQAADGVFDVLDKNGTDGEASFALPAPGTYTVWARALGTPGGQSKIATCATFIDPITFVATFLCSTDNEVFVRGTGKSSFKNVTGALTRRAGMRHAEREPVRCVSAGLPLAVRQQRAEAAAGAVLPELLVRKSRSAPRCDGAPTDS